MGADQKRFLKDTLAGKDPYERREIVATGLCRGEIEKSQLMTFMFYITPSWLVRRVMAEGEGHPLELKPDYLWFGTLEREYARKDFPSTEDPWKEVYRNPSVVLYARRNK